MSKYQTKVLIKHYPDQAHHYDVPKLEPYLKKAGISTKVWNSICRQCGDCCKLPSGEYCQHFTFKDGKGFCKLYPNHEGTILDKSDPDPQNWIICTSIAFVKEISPRCNYRLTFPEKVKHNDKVQ